MRANKNPASRRAGLLAVLTLSPFLSCSHPGSRKPRALSPCPDAPAAIVTAPLGAGVVAQQRGFRNDVRRQLGGRKAPAAI